MDRYTIYAPAIARRASGFFVLVAGFVLALVPLPAPAQRTGRLACPEPSFDFGRRLALGAVIHTFRLPNQGISTVEVTRVHVGCGCTTYELAQTQAAPGGVLEFTVRFDLNGRSGTHRHSLYLSTTDPLSPVIRLEVRGEVIPCARNRTVSVGAIRVAPTVEDFDDVKVDVGAVPVSADVVATVLIDPARMAGLVVTNIASNIEGVEGFIGYGNSNDLQQVEVRLKAPVPLGTPDGWIDLLTCNPQRQRLRLVLRGTVFKESEDSSTTIPRN